MKASQVLIIVSVLLVASYVSYNFGINQTGFFTSVLEPSQVEHHSPPSVVIEPGSGVEEASYIIFHDNEPTKNYYAKNGNTGEIEFSGTDASQVIQSCIDALPSSKGGVVYVKEGRYTIDTPVTITKENIHIKGVGRGGRTSGTSFTTSTLDDQQFFFTWTATTTSLRGGGLSNVQLYNTDITHQVGGVKLSGSTYSIQHMMFREIYSNYLWQPFLLDGFIWWNTFRDCSFEGYNAAFNGHSIIRMEKSNIQSSFWNAPKYNIFEGVLTAIQGKWVSGIYVNHSRANYNVFRDIRFLGMNLGQSLVYDAGASNNYDLVSGQDITIQDASKFKGMIVVELRDFPYAEGYEPIFAAGESAHGGFAGSFKNMFLSHNPRILLLNGAFQNDFELKIWGSYTVKINATYGGTDNRVKIGYSAHSHYYRQLKYEIYGDILVEGPGLVNSGTATGTSPITVAHGLTETPTIVVITPRTSCTFAITSRDATNFVITHDAGASVSFDWYAKV